jgi:hypothetical protein
MVQATRAGSSRPVALGFRNALSFCRERIFSSDNDRAAPCTLAPLLRFGSPTILVEGVDVPASRDKPPPPRPVESIGTSADFPASRQPRLSPWQSRIARRLRTRRGYQSRQPPARSGWPERPQSHDREPFGALLQTTAAKSPRACDFRGSYQPYGRKSRTVSHTVRQRRRFGCPHSPVARRAFRYKARAGVAGRPRP